MSDNQQPDNHTSRPFARPHPIPRRLALLLVVFSLLLLAFGWLPSPPLQASQPFPHHAGLVIQFAGGRVETACVDLAPLDDDGQATGYEVLQASAWGVVAEFSSAGAAVCKVDNTGCDFPATDCFCQCTLQPDAACVYWAYFHLVDNSWQYGELGASSRTVQPGDVEGWAWGPGTIGSSGTLPPVRTFEEICVAAPTETPTHTHIPATPTATATQAPPTPTSTPTYTPEPPSPTLEAVTIIPRTLTPTSERTATPIPLATDTEVAYTATPSNTPTMTRTPTSTPRPTWTKGPSRAAETAQSAPSTSDDLGSLLPTETPVSVANATATSEAEVATGASETATASAAATPAPTEPTQSSEVLTPTLVGASEAGGAASSATPGVSDSSQAANPGAPGSDQTAAPGTAAPDQSSGSVTLPLAPVGQSAAPPGQPGSLPTEPATLPPLAPSPGDAATASDTGSDSPPSPAPSGFAALPIAPSGAWPTNPSDPTAALFLPGGSIGGQGRQAHPGGTSSGPVAIGGGTASPFDAPAASAGQPTSTSQSAAPAPSEPDFRSYIIFIVLVLMLVAGLVLLQLRQQREP